MAEHREHRAADEHEERDLDGKGGEILVGEACDRTLVVAQHQHQERKRKADQEYPEQPAAGHRHPRAGTAAASGTASLARRSGSSAMTRLRSASLKALHRAISSSVRPQPRHSREAGSTMQTLMQGVSIAMTSGSAANIGNAARNAIDAVR